MHGKRNLVLYSEKFPKMSVSLIDAPVKPRHLIAFSYLECIEDRQLDSIDQISDKEAIDITKWVISGGHTPALESVHLTFNIRGVSKVFSHQIVRHRVGVSIDQRTQRANAEEYLGKFHTNGHHIVPPRIRDAWTQDANLKAFYDLTMKDCESLYNKLLKAGVPEDDARYCIPQSSETSMNFKVVYKSLMHICSTRLCHMMQGEMVECVRLMAECVREYDVLLGANLRPICATTKMCNRNENNPNDDNPMGVCELTRDGSIPIRVRDNTFNLTKHSRDNS